jgi:hypothetical protein
VHDPDVQIRLAGAESALRASRTYALEMTGQTRSAVQQGREVTPAMGADFTLAAQFAMRSGVGAPNLAFEIAGCPRRWRATLFSDAGATSTSPASTSRTPGDVGGGAGQALLALDVDSLYL